jgi:hypothetical protein
MKSLFRNTYGGILLLLLCNNSALAGSIGFVYTPSSNSFSSVQYPSSNTTGINETRLTGINDTGQIIGNYGDVGSLKGFLYDGSTFTSIEYPGAYYTEVNGINNAGQIVGLQATYPEGGRAFLKDGNSFTSFDYPGAKYTV